MKKFIAMMLVALAPLPAFAAEDASEVLTACRPENLTGVWDMIKLSANYNYDKKNPWFYPHQLVAFKKDGTFLFYTSEKQLTNTRVKELLPQLPKAEIYSLEPGGQLRTENKSTGDVMQYACLVFTKDKGVNKVGDILLAAGKQSGAIAVKGLRKSKVQE